MNKMLLKVLVILGLIAPVCADAAYKRVDSPGVAQRKLNLLLKDVREMTENEKQQALADLSPSVREDYKDMLAIAAKNKSLKNFIKKTIDKAKAVESLEDINNLISAIAKGYKLNAKESNEMKIFATKYFNSNVAPLLTKGGKNVLSSIDKVAPDQDEEEELELIQEDTQESSPSLVNVSDEVDQSSTNVSVNVNNSDESGNNLKLFLEKLSIYVSSNLSYLTTDLQSKDKDYLEKNKFYSNIEEYSDKDVLVNNFFLTLSKYVPSATYNPFSDNFDVVQEAFIKYFFPLVDFLAVQLKESSDPIAFGYAINIINKGNDMLNFDIQKNVKVKFRVYKNKSINQQASKYDENCKAIRDQYEKLSPKELISESKDLIPFN